MFNKATSIFCVNTCLCGFALAHVLVIASSRSLARGHVILETGNMRKEGFSIGAS